MSFGQIVIGPPGSGKTTYCFAMKEYFEYFGRSTLVINLDPANDSKDKFDIDIRDLITLDNVEDELSLGPNSSFLYCFNFLDNNIEWLMDKITHNKKYLIFDTPGQIEIYTLSDSFKNIIKKITNKFHLCAVNLIESINICELPRYIFSIFSVLNAMINLELPQINIISKIDIIKDNNEIPFPIAFYKNPSDYEKFKEYINDANINPKFKKLNNLISEFVIDYGLVSFDVLDVTNQKHLNKIAALVDKANGYIYANSGRFEEEKYIEIRNDIAKNDLEFEDDEDYYN